MHVRAEQFDFVEWSVGVHEDIIVELAVVEERDPVSKVLALFLLSCGGNSVESGECRTQ